LAVRSYGSTVRPVATIEEIIAGRHLTVTW
jgi:hypothetical protein